MDTKIVKEYLLGYAGLKATVENQREQITRAKNNTEIPAMKESDGSQHQPGGSDRLGATVIRWMETENRLKPLIEANLSDMRLTEDAINSLDDPYEALVLNKRYIFVEGFRRPTWQEIAMSIYRSDDEYRVRAAQRLHGQALHSLGLMIEADERYEAAIERAKRRLERKQGKSHQ